MIPACSARWIQVDVITHLIPWSILSPLHLLPSEVRRRSLSVHIYVFINTACDEIPRLDPSDLATTAPKPPGRLDYMLPPVNPDPSGSWLPREQLF